MPGVPPPGDARGRASAAAAARRWAAARRRSSWCWPAASACRSSSDVVIGRSPGSTLQLDDPSVSRTHARISAGDGAADRGRRLEPRHVRRRRAADAARSRCATAMRIRIGDQELTVERRRGGAEAGRTIVVRPGASLVVGAVGAAPARRAGDAVRHAAAGALGLRAQAPGRRRGRAPLGAARPRRATATCGCPTTTRSCSSCSTARARSST